MITFYESTRGSIVMFKSCNHVHCWNFINIYIFFFKKVTFKLRRSVPILLEDWVVRHQTRHFVSCLTTLNVNIRKWMLRFWSVPSYVSFDLKPRSQTESSKIYFMHSAAATWSGTSTTLSWELCLSMILNSKKQCGLIQEKNCNQLANYCGTKEILKVKASSYIK